MLCRIVIALVGLAAGLTACGGQPTPPGAAKTAPTAHVPASIASFLANDGYLRRHSYSPRLHVVSKLDGGTALHVIASVCAGSADGHCQSVDVFRGDTGPVWHKQYVTVTAIAAAPQGFRVTAPGYAPNDPLCCPSKQAMTEIYTWTGIGFVRSGSR